MMWKMNFMFSFALSQITNKDLYETVNRPPLVIKNKAGVRLPLPKLEATAICYPVCTIESVVTVTV